MLGGKACHGLDAGPGVALQRPQVDVPRLGHQQHERDAVFAEVGDGAVPELMEGGSLTDIIDHNKMVEPQIACISQQVISNIHLDITGVGTFTRS